MNRRPGSIVFGLIVGLVVAVLSYQWLTDRDRGIERALQERVVLASRSLLKLTLEIEALEIVDPLAPQRKVGKVYVYPQDGGWEVSGFYRRSETDRWHPYLSSLNAELSLLSLKVKDKDPTLEHLAAVNAQLSIKQ